jgi:carboxylesterase
MTRRNTRRNTRGTSGTAPIKPGAEPFSHDGGPFGVLLSHGFTGSPVSMTPWGRHLADLGYTVRVPRLPGHGTRWQDMTGVGWDDWYGELDAALSDLRSRCDRIAVCGLSMGGALSLRLAQQRPDDVDALVLVNPAVTVNDPRLTLLPVLKHVVPSLPGISNDIKKPGADETGYTRTPLRPLSSLLAGWKLVRDDLPAVKAPLLLFRSIDDHVVDETSLDLIRRSIGSGVAEYVTLTNSFHVATLDFDAQLIFDRSADFIAEHLGGSE